VTINTLLGINSSLEELSLLLSLSLTNGLGDGHTDPLLHASVAELVMLEETEGAAEGDAARMTSLGGGEGDSSLDGLGTMVLGVGVLVLIVLHVDAVLVLTVAELFVVILLVLVLGVDTEGDELGTGDVASEDLSLTVIISQLAVLGELEGDLDSALRDVIRVDDVRFAGGQRRVEADASELMSEGELNGGGGVGHRDADDGMALPRKVGTNVMPSNEQEGEYHQEERNKAKLDGLAEAALGLPLSGSAGPAMAELAPEAAPLSRLADNEFDVGLVDGVDGFLLVLREL